MGWPLTLSFIAHILFFYVCLSEVSHRDQENIQRKIYSVTLAGGKELGGIAQVPDKKNKVKKAPPKKAQQKKEKKVEAVKKKEVTPVKKKKEKVKEVKKEEPKKQVKKVEKKPPPPKKKDPPKEKPKPKAKAKEDYDSKLNQAMQRYLGESTDAGGSGFGAGRVSDEGGTGGGELRPPEFFKYKRVLESHIKGGWRWHNTSRRLVCQVQLRLEKNGRVSQVSLVRSSGNREFDDSALRAVKKANPVPPIPSSVYQYFKVVRMTFDPME